MKIIRAYHGSNARFAQFEQSKSRVVNDYYGGGVAYFTDTLKVAKNYASNMARRNGGDQIIYEVSLSMKKVFDVDDIFTGRELQTLIGTDVEGFARGAKLLKLGDDRIKVIRDLREGNIELTGDQVFRGLSNGMINSNKARNRLISSSYDTLRYNGGALMRAEPHDVYLPYKSNNITIKNRYIVSKTPVSSPSEETYTFIN